MGTHLHLHKHTNERAPEEIPDAELENEVMDLIEYEEGASD